MNGPGRASGGPAAERATGPVAERPTRRVGAVAVGLLLLLGIAGLSRLPWSPGEGDAGLLRLSWRFQGRMAEDCRVLSAEELEELPVHMRNPDACRQEGLAYRLRIAVDDALLVDRLLEPAGARRDRPIYVLDQLPLAPGVHGVRVTFGPEGQEVETGDADEARALAWSGPVEIRPRRAVLLTRDAETGRLELRTGPAGGGA